MALGRKTGGRKPGSLNLKTIATMSALNAAIASPGNAEDIDAITLLKRVYRSTAVALPVRIDCAKAALKHEVPTLQSVEQKHTGDVEGRTTRIEVVYVSGPPAGAVPG